MIIGSKMIFAGHLPSTNTHLIHLLKENELPEGTIVHASYQSSGRGQLGNSWESEDGKNLLISILLRPSFINPGDQFIISMAVSLGICDFLNRHVIDSSIKWPNDIYVNNDKIAGILIENSIMGNQIEYTVAGIGLNINQETFASKAANPVSMKLITRKDFDLVTCLAQLASDLDMRYKQVLSGNLNKIRNEYISRLYRFNDWNNFTDSAGTYNGRIISVASNGILTIEKRSGSKSDYFFKEVEFVI